MDISNIFYDINKIKSFLNELNNSDWEAQDISPNKIQQFLDRHLKIIANRKDFALHKQLMQLSSRINKEWNNPVAHNLSFVIMGIAKGVLEFEGDLPSVIWQTGIWGEILSHIPPRGDEVRLRKGGIPSELEAFYPSKAANDVARKEEQKWAGEQLVSLRKYGCKTAKEAIEYAIKNQLKGANLSEFPDLDESDLYKLFGNCQSLNQLVICSNKIQNLPEAASRLKTLSCSGCQNLQTLPKLSQLQMLDCRRCHSLQSLPKLPQVQKLDCHFCQNLQCLPQLPQVQWLDCSGCGSLQSLPELPQVKTLDCRRCQNLQSLPEISQVKKLDCHLCQSLKSLPELPQVQWLDCSRCQNLQSLPQLSEVQRLDCSECQSLQSLPELPQVQWLDCSGCGSLQSLPELPQVQKLYCIRCRSMILDKKIRLE